MNNYTAIVVVAYHSGSTMPIHVQVAATSVAQAHVLLEHLYGIGSVRSVPAVIN